MPRLILAIGILQCLIAGVRAVHSGQSTVLEMPDYTVWQEKIFSGKTRYFQVEEDGRKLLKAESNATASGLVCETRVDLRQTPWLNWEWKINDVLNSVPERSKDGDDYPARIYVVVKGGLTFWQTKALSYVWSSTEARGSEWPNAFTASARMVAVESGRPLAGCLIYEKRNIREDWERAFGEDIAVIDAVAIMTDTDNSGQSAAAWYGRIWFSAE